MAKVKVIPPADYKKTAQLRCAAYYHVSTSTEDQKNSYEMQIRYFVELFEDSETEKLIGIYADEGISGTFMSKQTEFQRLMNDCRNGKIDRIYAKSISQFARDTKDCLKCIRELKGLVISMYFEKENIDTLRVTDEITITVMGELAQEEAQFISGNVSWSHRHRMENGMIRNFSPHYCYDKDK